MNKKKLQYLKENIVWACIWNITLIPLIAIPITYINLPIYLKVGTIIVVYISFVATSIKDWYVEERIDILEKKLKELN